MSGEIVEVPVAEIGPGPKVRRERLDLDHVARLRHSVDAVPAIFVNQSDKGYVVLDGNHRLAAARAEGREVIRAVIVHLDEAEAFELAVEQNVTHGLPLAEGERHMHARTLLTSTAYSDRTIARIVGLSHTTIAKVRGKIQLETPLPVGRSEGADGKARPASKAEQKAQREAIAAMLAEHPDLSLATVADRIGCSPMTVASVRTEMQKIAEQREAAHPSTPPAAPNPAPDAPSGSSDAQAPEGGPRPALGIVPPTAEGPDSVGDIADACPVPGEWSKHKAMLRSNASRDAATFLDRRLVRPDDVEAIDYLAAAVPAELRAGAAREARDAARFWTALDARLTHPSLAAVEER